MRISIYQNWWANPFEKFLRGLSTNEKQAFQAMDQPEAFILARSLMLAKSELNCHSTQETYTRVQSEMPIHLWGGNSQFTKYWHSTQDTKTTVQSEGVCGGRSQNVGIPSRQSSLGMSGVGIHKMLALHPIHRHQGIIRAP